MYYSHKYFNFKNMKYIQISHLDLPAIPKNYTFFLELNDDSSFNNGVGISKDKMNKYDNPKDPNNTFWEWLKNKVSFSEEEVKKYKIDRNEFMVVQQEATRDQRKN